MLTLRDIKLRYKQTLLGITWVVLQPILSALLFAGIFGRGMGISHEESSYLLFAFSALIPWTVFSRSLERASPSIVADTRLITKVYFPRVFIPLSATLGVGIDYLVTVILGLVLCLAEGLPIGRFVIGFPLATLHLFLFCGALNTLIAGLNVPFRDLKHIVPFGIQLAMIASPIVYPLSMIPEGYQALYQLNPLVGIVELYRHLLIGGSFPMGPWISSVVATLVLIASSLLLFHKLERNFADVI